MHSRREKRKKCTNEDNDKWNEVNTLPANQAQTLCSSESQKETRHILGYSSYHMKILLKTHTSMKHLC